MRTRGSKLFQQGDKAEYIYVIKNGEVRQFLKQYHDRPNFVDTETKEIFKQPWQAASHHSEHMTKNSAKTVE